MKTTKIIPFQKYRYFAIGLSALLLVIFSAGTVLHGGFTWGVDFAGGVKLIAAFNKDVSMDKIRDSLARRSINAMVQQIGPEGKNEYIIATKLLEKGESSEKSLETIKKALTDDFKTITILSVETVGPAIGNYLKREAVKLFVLSLIMMMVYLTFRFEFKFGLGALLALIHDVALSVAFCGFFKIEMNIPIIAAVLTIFGYSGNDTIVIFDRIRETLGDKTKLSIADVVDVSVTHTLSRTILTSLLTLFAVVSLYLLGGDVIRDFALVLMFGIFIGTYSSIYIASPIVVWWEKVIRKKAV